MENETNYEAVVIGAGIMGSTTAYYLSKLYGDKILLLEQFDFLHRRGSSHGDSRITRKTYPQDYYTLLMKRAYELWSEAEEESGTKVFVKTGGLDFAPKDNPGILSMAKSLKKHNVSHETLTPAQVSAKYPPIQLPENYTAIYSPDSGVLKATKAVSMFQNLAKQNGCRLEDNVKIQQITSITGNGNGNGNHQSKSKFQIETETHGKFTSKKLVVTAGAWTQKVLDKIKIKEDEENGGIAKEAVDFDLKLPLQPIQTTAVYWEVETPEEFSGLNMKFPVFIAYENMIYGCPAIEFPNMIKCAAHHGPNTDPDKRDFHPGMTDIEEEVGPFVQSVFKGVSKKPGIVDSCMYTMTPDSDYIIDTIDHQGIQGLYVGCGFSGHGFKAAPVVGTMLAGLVVDGKNPFESVENNFKLSRFGIH